MHASTPALKPETCTTRACRTDPNRLLEAEAHFKAAKDMRVRTLGDNHVHVANVLLNMGDMYRGLKGEEENAAKCYRDAFAIYDSNSVKNKAIKCLMPLPALYRAIGKEDLALKAERDLAVQS